MNSAAPDIRSILKTTVLPLLLLLATLIYLPGLGSRFLLDDFYNLQNLDQVKEYGYGAYVFGSGFAGPSGRPLSLLTFAFQYEQWPSNPAAFKFVNICLHLLNGVLVYLLCNLLAGLVTREHNRRFLWSVIVTLLWLLHPIQISTTLYVVQRMTQVSTLFTLLGVVGYLHFRLQSASDHDWRRLLFMSMVVIVCTVLAILAKENGILLPLYLLIIEGTLLAKSGVNKYLAVWKWLFLGLPMLVLAIYLAVNFSSVASSYQSQDYSMGQKVLTELVVVTQYMQNIVAPRPAAFGLYHDDFPTSSSLWSPPVTLISALFIFCLLWLALKKRQTYPVFSFSVLWFLGGHLLESTYLNLELYFEHRNYLPSFGLFFLVAWLGTRAADFLQRKWLVYMAAGVYCLLVIAVTIVEIELWSKPGIQAVEWARRHPHSERAMQDLLQFYLVNDDIENAETTITRLINLAPSHIYHYLNRLNIRGCRLRSTIADAEWMEYMESAGRAQADKLRTAVMLDQIVLNVLKGLCTNVDTARLIALIKRLNDNPEFSNDSAYLYEYLSALALYAGDTNNGLMFIRLSLQKEFTIPRKLSEVQLLYRMGEKGQAQAGKQQLLERIREDYRLQWGYGRMIESLEFK
ncbi:MAG: hypothetical protein HW411_361 [Gammaproteobacteria bacterium]|nr:hypothetical protein [Gammaproteobacteria bacterium]